MKNKVLILSVLSSVLIGGCSVKKENHQHVAPSYNEYGNLYGYTDEAVDTFEDIYHYREVSVPQWDSESQYAQFISTIGTEIPDAVFQDLNGNDVQISDVINGDNLLLEFLSDNCEYCEQQLGNYETDIRNNNEDVTFYEIYVGTTDVDTVKNIYENDEINTDDRNILIAKDEEDYSTFISTLKLSGYPSFYFVDSSNKVSWSHIGVLSDYIFQKIKPYAFGSSKRIYDMRIYPLSDKSRDYEEVRNDLTIEARNKITLLSEDTMYPITVYDNIGRYFHLSDELTDMNGNTIKKYSDNIVCLFMTPSDVKTEDSSAIEAFNEFQKNNPNVTCMTIIIGNSDANDSDESSGTSADSYYYSFEVKPDGYVLDSESESFPSDFYHLIYLYQFPSVIYINNADRYIAGAYIGDWTEEKLIEAYQLFCGNEPVAEMLENEKA